VVKNLQNDFIRFIVECVHNLIHGNFEGPRKSQFETHSKVIKLLVKRKISRTKQKKILASADGLNMLKVLSPFIFDKFAS
jgi:hypothetical protein